MTYNKPEVVKLNSALKAIQGFLNKPLDVFPDRQTGEPTGADISAYEADE